MVTCSVSSKVFSSHVANTCLLLIAYHTLHTPEICLKPASSLSSQDMFTHPTFLVSLILALNHFKLAKDPDYLLAITKVSEGQ